jgi:imidazolonepropionase-like amidohydrolase
MRTRARKRLDRSRRSFLKTSGLSLGACLLLGSEIDGATRENSILIRDGLIIDGTENAPRRGSILIVGDRIARISSRESKTPVGTTVIEGQGRTVLPGLVDMHAHLISGGFDTISEKSMSYDPVEQQRALKQMLYWGVTAAYVPVQPLASGLALQTAIARNNFASPRLFISGPGFTAPGGWGGANQPEARIELENPNNISTEVSRLANSNVHILKLFYDDMSSSFVSPLPKLKRELMEVVIKEAHARKLKVMVHAYRTTDHKDAMRAGADIMAHSAITDPVDAEYIELARRSKTLYLATLSVYHDVFNENAIRELVSQEFVQRTVPQKTLKTLTSQEPLNSFEKSIKQDFIKKQLPTISANLKSLSESGIPIGIGPDTGVPGSFPGIAVHREMELMVNAGVTPAAVLIGATSTAAKYLGQQSFGKLAQGNIADLVVLKGNPLEDIRNSRKVEVVIKAGKVVDREALLTEIMSN